MNVDVFHWDLLHGLCTVIEYVTISGGTQCMLMNPCKPEFIGCGSQSLRLNPNWYKT